MSRIECAGGPRKDFMGLRRLVGTDMYWHGVWLCTSIMLGIKAGSMSLVNR